MSYLPDALDSLSNRLEAIAHNTGKDVAADWLAAKKLIAGILQWIDKCAPTTDQNTVLKRLKADLGILQTLYGPDAAPGVVRRPDSDLETFFPGFRGEAKSWREGESRHAK